MVRDIRQLIGMKPQIESVYHPATSGYSKISFQVMIVIAHEGGYPIATAQSGLAERASQPSSAPVEIGIGVAMNRPVGLPRNDFNFSEKLVDPLQQVHQGQRIIHHQPVHGASSGAGC